MYHILYVDDDLALLEVSKIFLEHSGQFSVDTIASASAAFTLLDSHVYDAIVSDYQMPEMDGIEFLRNVRVSGNTIPFILFTGRGREEVVIQALNEGANFYLQKGGDPKSQFVELSHKIMSAIEHNRDTEKIQSLNRLYSVISAIDRAIVHLRTKSEFFSEICHILVETGGFRMAWIGLADPALKIIRPVASAGYIDGYLDTVNISTEESPRGYGPTGTAYREGKTYICNDISSDPHMEPWREDALKRGYLTCAAFPFGYGTKNVGVLVLYASVSGFFSEQTINLLDELVVDIAFALKTIDDQNDRELTAIALLKSEALFRALFTQASQLTGVLDLEGRLTRANAAAMVLVGTDSEQVIGKPFWETPWWSNDPDTQAAMKDAITRAVRGESVNFDAIHKDAAGNVHYIDFFLTPVMDTRGNIIALLPEGRDITERKRMEEINYLANKKINILSSITLHDLNNQILALKSYLEISKQFFGDAAKMSEFINKEEQIANTIEHQITFTKQYEDIGVDKPLWQGCHSLVDNATKLVALGNVTVKNDLTVDFEVLAEPMIIKVFYNLIENAVRYGEKITTIRFSAEERGNDHVVVCEDDGVGVPSDEKEKIFGQGYGKNTGLGLFLCREILAITDMTIHENGGPGKGARFEIKVPKGMYRIQHDPS
jgi:PAS domain S-box-containing protein